MFIYFGYLFVAGIFRYLLQSDLSWISNSKCVEILLKNRNSWNVPLNAYKWNDRQLKLTIKPSTVRRSFCCFFFSSFCWFFQKKFYYVLFIIIREIYVSLFSLSFAVREIPIFVWGNFIIIIFFLFLFFSHSLIFIIFVCAFGVHMKWISKHFSWTKNNKPTEWNEFKNHKKTEKRTEQKATNFDLNELSLLNRFESANELTNVKTKRSWSWKKESNEKKT